MQKISRYYSSVRTTTLQDPTVLFASSYSRQDGFVLGILPLREKTIGRELSNN